MKATIFRAAHYYGASPEVLELEKSFLKSGDYQKAVAIREPISVSHFN